MIIRKKNDDMKQFTAIIFVILVITGIFSSGCINTRGTAVQTITAPNQTPAPPQTLAPTQTQTLALFPDEVTQGIEPASDPIVGTWRYYLTDSDGTKILDYRMKFGADGIYAMSYDGRLESRRTDFVVYVSTGTWENSGGNYYTITLQDGTSETYVLNLKAQKLWNAKFTSIIYTPFNGDIEKATTTVLGASQTLAVTRASGAQQTTVASLTTPPPSGSSGGSHLINMTGSGDDVKKFTVAGTGLQVFRFTHDGDSDFMVWLKNSKGKLVALLVSEKGSYSGTTSRQLSAGVYYLEISADGTWSVQISS